MKYIKVKHLNNTAFDKKFDNSDFSLRPLGTDITLFSIFLSFYILKGDIYL